MRDLVLVLTAFAALASTEGCAPTSPRQAGEVERPSESASSPLARPAAVAASAAEAGMSARGAPERQASDRPEDLLAALWIAAGGGGDPFAAIARAATCEDCLESLAWVLEDEREPASRRVLAARVLLTSSRVEASAEVLTAIGRIDPVASADLRMQLVGVLVDVGDAAAAASLRDALAERGPADPSLHGSDLSPDEHAALIAGVRRALGEGVAHQLLSSLPETADPAAVRSAVADLGDPALTAEVVLAAHDAGDPSEARRLIDALLVEDTPEILDSLLLLAGGDALEWSEASSLARDWVERLVAEGGAPPHDLIVDHLSRFDASPEERRFAVAALAGEIDHEQARTALAKALVDETDPSVIEAIDDVVRAR